MILTPSELERYSQQIKLDQIGRAGQLKLKQAHVLCVGAGGLGSAVLLYLAAAGVGTLGIVDDDRLELSNLQRQILYKDADRGTVKTEAAKQHLLALNPNLTIHAYPERLIFENAAQLFHLYDIIADCSDNFATRYLIADQAHALDKPHVYASVRQFEGQVALFLGKKTPCFRCLFPDAPPAELFPPCVEGGVLGVLPGLLGSLQAAEILKWILGFDLPLAGKLMLIQLLAPRFSVLALERNKACLLCGGMPSLS